MRSLDRHMWRSCIVTGPLCVYRCMYAANNAVQVGVLYSQQTKLMFWNIEAGPQYSVVRLCQKC